MAELSKGLEIIGKIIDIDGPLLKYTRRFASGQPGVFHAYVGMPFYRYEVFQTDENTKAVFSSLSGAQMDIEEAERIVIVDPRNIKTITPYKMDPTMSDLDSVNTKKELFKTTMSIRLQREIESYRYRRAWESGRAKRFEIETGGGALGIDDMDL